MIEILNNSASNRISLKAFNKEGFTLAEVLITLGIIGVVAAMTIPNLMTNIQGIRVRAQLKKTISTLNQAVRLNVANYDWDFTSMQSVNCDASDNPEESMSICALLSANLTGETYLGNGYSALTYIDNVDAKWMYPHTSMGGFVVYQLQDGVIFGFNNRGGCSKNSATLWNCIGFIDVNGKNLPNKFIKCDREADTKYIFEEGYSDCTASLKGQPADMFEILFYDSTVEPASNAGKYILNTSK